MGIFAGNRDLLDAFRRGDGDALVRVYEEFFDSVAAITLRGFTVLYRPSIPSPSQLGVPVDLVRWT